MCERNYCMFKHEHEETNEKNESESELLEEEIVTFDDQSEHDESMNLEDSNMTFSNPSQANKTSNDDLFKCDKCDFASARKDIIDNHKELLHNWCSICLLNFANQKNLKNHVRNEHSDNKA